MNVSIIYYEEGTPVDRIKEVMEQVTPTLVENGYKVLALPKSFDLLLNCSVDQLLSVRALIDMALTTMVNAEKFTGQVSMGGQEETDDKIIDISKYLS